MRDVGTFRSMGEGKGRNCVGTVLGVGYTLTLNVSSAQFFSCWSMGTVHRLCRDEQRPCRGGTHHPHAMIYDSTQCQIYPTSFHALPPRTGAGLLGLPRFALSSLLSRLAWLVVSKASSFLIKGKDTPLKVRRRRVQQRGRWRSE